MTNCKPLGYLRVCVVSILVAVLPCQAVNRVFLLGGQSNMVGRGLSTELVPPYSTAQTDVNYWSFGAWVPLSPGFGYNGGFGPEVSFGRAIKDALPNDTIYLVKYAVGGTALFNDWKQTTGPQYIGFMDTVNAALANLSASGIDYGISGMLWMQGESDAYEGEAASSETNMDNFIADMRTQFDAPKMPFIIARVRDFYGKGAPADLVRQAQQALAEKMPHVAWFDTDDCGSLINGGHYALPGVIEIGNRFAETYMETVSETNNPWWAFWR